MAALESLERDILELADWYTHELFASFSNDSVMVRFPVSRFVLDHERYEEDSSEPMAERGMGVVYTHLSDGTPYRARLAEEIRDQLIERY